MKSIPPKGDMVQKIVNALEKTSLFKGLAADQVGNVIEQSELQEFTAGENLINQGAASEGAFVLLSGEAEVTVLAGDELLSLARLKAPKVVGEMGLVLSEPRTASVTAVDKVVALYLDKNGFNMLFERVPAFARTICRELAQRLQATDQLLPLPEHDDTGGMPSDELAKLLPMELMQRHRVVPVEQSGKQVTLGLVADPSSKLVAVLRAALPGMDIKSTRVTDAFVSKVLSGIGGVSGVAVGESASSKPASSPALDAILKRMVAEGASDLHLSALHKPFWRLHGDILVLRDMKVLKEESAFELLRPVMDKVDLEEFDAEADVDFAYAIPGVARFRVNLFRDLNGSGAVLRQIPEKIMSMEQLALPQAVYDLCNIPKGLVVVTGPTGSGKSTTLAAMIDHINRNRKSHIITLEDPVEFVHPSRMSLVNQREVGKHTKSFARALSAALREDPDIVLIGEMRDLETISLAMETANTGHLVFGTLHTATAVSTMDRIINSYPADEQDQVRNTLSETLKGVVAQTLCKRQGGGRIAAYEVLISDPAMSNLIREGKTVQIPSQMEMGRQKGNCILNEQLALLVNDGKVSKENALEKTPDKPDLTRRLQ